MWLVYSMVHGKVHTAVHRQDRKPQRPMDGMHYPMLYTVQIPDSDLPIDELQKLYPLPATV